MTVLLVAGLCACGRMPAAPETRGPFQPSAARDAATIQGHYRVEGRFYEGFSLCGVDGRSILDTQSQYEQRIRVDAGPRRLTLVAAYIRADTPGLMEASVDLDAILKPGTHYRVIGRTFPRHVEIWLEEANGGALVTPLAQRYGERAKPEPGPQVSRAYRRGDLSACRSYY